MIQKSQSKRTRRARGMLLALSVVMLVPLATVSVDARPGGGSSFGSRGTRTFSAPPATMTAPRAQPIQRSDAPQPGFNSMGSAAAPIGAQPRRFGFGSGLAAGLLGAGLFGMLSGNGFFGGLGGLASMFGFLLQVALIGGLIMLGLRFLRSRAGGPAFAGPAGPINRSGFGGLGGNAGPVGARPASTRPITIGPQDYQAFERTLTDIEIAFGREDMGTLSRLTTSEMAREFNAELETNRARGQHNDVSDPKLLQGDLAEAWQEGQTDYATVAMRFSIRDVTIDRASRRVVSGNPNGPIEATEFWTFRRDRGGPWLLSAIQQAA